MGGMKIPKNFKAGGKMPNMHMDANQMSKLLPPHMLQMMGGASLTIWPITLSSSHISLEVGDI